MKRYQLNGKLQVVKVTEAPEKIEFRDEEEGSKLIMIMMSKILIG